MAKNNPQKAIKINPITRPSNSVANDEAHPGPKPVENTANAAMLALLKVEAEARAAQTPQELIFLIANEMRKLTRARQVFVVKKKTARKMSIVGINAMDAVDRNTPLVRWVERMIATLHKRDGTGERRLFSLPAYCGKNDEENKTYPFPEFVWLPLALRDDTVFGGILMAREQPWADADLVVAERLAATFSHAWVALTGNRRLRSKGKTRKLLVGGALACMAATLMFPVPMSALAPAEIVASDPFVVTAPIDGVIEKVFVEPNTNVRGRQPLLKFVDVTLRNRLKVADRETVVAQTQLRRFSQSAFDDADAKRELRTALSQLELKRAEAKFARELLGKTVVTAQKAGIAVFSDKNEWTGRPVSVGERIMEIANPTRIKLKLELSVDDAIVVEKDAHVKVYLDSDPLHPRAARVISTAHEARKTASDVLAYEITAQLEKDGRETPRLGVRGTAQIYGEKAPLLFYLFRRPLSALRQKLGV